MPQDDLSELQEREVAFVTYFNALLDQDDGTLSPPDGSSSGSGDGRQRSVYGHMDRKVVNSFEDLRDGRIIAEALDTIDPRNFSPPSSASSSDPLCLLRRIYHSILTSPSCLPLAYLPAPDLALITTFTSKLSTSTRARYQQSQDPDAWKQPLLELCQLTLVAQAVYGRSNALVVGKIRNGIGLQDQKVLKEIIEDVLIYIAEEGGSAEDPEPDVDEAAPNETDEIDQINDQLETATVTETQTEFSSGTSTSDPHEMELIIARRSRAERIKEKTADREAKRFYELQVKRRVDGEDREALMLEVDRMRSELSSVRGELDDTKVLLRHQTERLTSSEDEKLDSPNPTTQYGRTSTGAQQAMGKIREMEMEKMRLDLNKQEEALRHQEGLLEEKTRLLDSAIHRNTELQAQLDRMASLKDELEIHKHSTEKLRKAENVVEKLKKKLDETADSRRECRVLESRISDLQGENAYIQERYRQLLLQDSGASVLCSPAEGPNFELQTSQAELARSQSNWHEVYAELQVARDRIARLEERLEATIYFNDVEEAEEDAVSPAHDLQQRERVAGLENVLQTIGDPPVVTEMSEDQKLRALGWHEKATLLAEQLKASEAKLAKACKLLRQQEDKLNEGKSEVLAAPSAAFAEAEAIYQKQISDLRRDLESSQQKMETMQRGFRQEKFLALKAWDDLSQRTLKTQEGGRAVPISWLERQRELALASPRLRKSKG